MSKYHRYNLNRVENEPPSQPVRDLSAVISLMSFPSVIPSVSFAPATDILDKTPPITLGTFLTKRCTFLLLVWHFGKQGGEISFFGGMVMRCAIFLVVFHFSFCWLLVISVTLRYFFGCFPFLFLLSVGHFGQQGGEISLFGGIVMRCAIFFLFGFFPFLFFCWLLVIFIGK